MASVEETLVLRTGVEVLCLERFGGEVRVQMCVVGVLEYRLCVPVTAPVV